MNADLADQNTRGAARQREPISLDLKFQIISDFKFQGLAKGKFMAGRRLYLPLLLVLVSGTYLYTATERAVLDDGDALYAHIAQQMVARGDWVTPHANGVRFLDKPPKIGRASCRERVCYVV